MILAIDQGTTGTTCIVFDEEGRPAGPRLPRVRASTSRGPAGWSTTRTRSGRSRARWRARRTRPPARPALAGIGITNQRETVVAWDPRTGEPLHRAIVWQDRRTAARCDELRAAGHEPLFRERTGLVLDPYFSGTKIEWLRREGGVPDGRGVRHDRLLARLQAHGPPRDRLLERVAHAAVRHPLARLGPRAVRAPRRGSGVAARAARRAPAVFGETGELGGSVPVAGIAGDQQAALYGQACHSPGLGKNTYGTGSFVLENAGPARRRRPWTGCSPPSPGAWRGAWTTRSRRRSS